MTSVAGNLEEYSAYHSHVTSTKVLHQVTSPSIINDKSVRQFIER